MPPSSPPSEHLNTDEQAPLSDQDVAILHQIITSAQQLPDVERLPFRAIFEAYDTVLAQNNLDPDHDQVYLRFLFRLGGKGLPGETLYQRFETLLEELGIRLEFDAEGEALQEVTQDLRNDENEEGHTTRVSPMHEDNPRGRQRRASFNSMYDAGDEITQRSGQRDLSRSSLSRLEIHGPSVPDARPSTRATTRATERTQPHVRQTESATDQPRRGRLTAQEFATNLQHYQRRKRSTSSQRNIHVWRRSGSRDSYGSRRRHPLLEQNQAVPQPAEGSFEETLSSLPEGNIESGHVVPAEVLYRPSGTQMIRDAETFDHYRLQSILRKSLRRWCNVVWQQHNDHQKLEAMAHKLDSEALLRQGFDHWRSTYQEKRHAAETDRFFAHLEQRASKARDVHLLTKAFTHWAQSASDEVMRTSVARRHILRTKYFNAWREITAVNELKVRRQRLTKFFGLWRRRYNKNLAENAKAITVYHGNLVESVYWRWFWKFCEHRAPQWRAGRIKRKYLANWAAAVKRIIEREGWVESSCRDSVQRSTLRGWLERTRIILSCEREAVIFRRRRLLASLLPEWQARLRLAPMARQISNSADWRIVYSVFSTWVFRFRAVGQAAQVDRSRVLRNGWTSWNDHLRWQTLAHRIDDRVVTQALYRWVLAERCILLRRHFTQRSKHRVLSRFVNQWSTLEGRLLDQEGIVRQSRDRSLLRLVCDRWRHKLELVRRQEQLAFEFNAPRVAQETLRAWSVRLQNVRQLQRWANDAEFYVFTTLSIKRWQNATTESKRQKRRKAYAQVRRRIKMNLASRVIVPWRERTGIIIEMQRQAVYTYQSHLFNIGTNIFDHWRRRLDDVLNMKNHAESVYEASPLQRCLQSWTSLFQRQRIKQEQALSYYVEMHVSSVAASLLRKLSLRVFEIRSRQETAESLMERNNRKHFRNIFRHWQDSVSQRRLRQHQAPLQSGTARRRTRIDDDYNPGSGHGGRAEEGPASDDGFDLGDWIPSLEAHSNTPLLPGYLSTPSKRAERAKTLVRISTTPRTPAGPKATPFERRLRLQSGTDPRTSVRRSQLGRSTGTWKSRFKDIQEGSPQPFEKNGNG
ncbi:MAG: hypothetical protein M1830_008059 [Pleopsidium flavum]|nr:MAG: hypothetical protein M1830_008059 [Pleopsidium flavum]